MMRIGIDFDNTIVSYDRLFTTLATERGWLPQDQTPAKGWNKRHVAQSVRLHTDGEIKWQKLQADAYGPSLDRSEMMPGFDLFFANLQARKVPWCIVSHKTEYAKQDVDKQHSLHHAAIRWLEKYHILPEDNREPYQKNVHFAATRTSKIEKISALGCTHFIDDLEAVLNDPHFPKTVHKFWLHNGCDTAPGLKPVTWDQINVELFGN